MGVLHRFHCAFSFTKTGELMIEDVTQLQVVHVFWIDHKGRRHCEDDGRYNLAGGPQHRRIIPIAAPSPPGKIVIEMMEDFRFVFVWKIDIWRRETVDKARARFAGLLAAGKTTTQLTVPHTPREEWEDVSHYTPFVDQRADLRPHWETHPYWELGYGSFGTVCKVVDLATGKLWAVKSCLNPKTGDERWKKDFQMEVEALAKVQHVRN